MCWRALEQRVSAGVHMRPFKGNSLGREGWVWLLLLLDWLQQDYVVCNSMTTECMIQVGFSNGALCHVQDGSTCVSSLCSAPRLGHATQLNGCDSVNSQHRNGSGEGTAAVCTSSNCTPIQCTCQHHVTFSQTNPPTTTLRRTHVCAPCMHTTWQPVPIRWLC